MDSGASATFNANVQGGTQPYSYTWYVNGTANGSNQSMNFTAQQTGTYSINVNVTDSENPIQQISSKIITVTVPEYSSLLIVLLWAAIPFLVLARKKRSAFSRARA
jgi:PKD repeat protein